MLWCSRKPLHVLVPWSGRSQSPGWWDNESVCIFNCLDSGILWKLHRMDWGRPYVGSRAGEIPATVLPGRLSPLLKALINLKMNEVLKKTVHFCSSGHLFIWIWAMCPTAPMKSTHKHSGWQRWWGREPGSTAAWGSHRCPDAAPPMPGTLFIWDDEYHLLKPVAVVSFATTAGKGQMGYIFNRLNQQDQDAERATLRMKKHEHSWEGKIVRVTTEVPTKYGTNSKGKANLDVSTKKCLIKQDKVR